MASKSSSRGTARGARGGTAPKKASSRSQNTNNPQRRQTDDSDHSGTDPFADDEIPQRRSRNNNIENEGHGSETIEVDDEDAETKKTIPPELLTRILHEFFEKDGTRISRDANKAIAKYMDIFVREAIARTAVEKGSGFLEVSDLDTLRSVSLVLSHLL
ncbi:CENP-S associating centromere protein X-domain-containing protein [Xylaria bambusicola]|uniref:CENP-S associating centromere protein X-domain-containing protein n=1 Tax=Xylaria bambusicola TaxID=326684 RepID=UPI0020087F40|nr:CENP-S associating centromere protein X-domain-containing protein [Xylaria bambusicola]KAI0518254.1 CENP-S associating centromere protein X-domain-containing protein [Xylaria bambusicola]